MKLFTLLFAFLVRKYCKCLIANDDILFDSYKTRAIDDFKEYCPYTDICTQSYTVKPMEPLCCMRCNCSKGCEFDCCPDHSEPFMTLDVAAQIRQSSCVEANFPQNPTVYLDHPDNYIMIASCPDHNSAIWNGVAKEYCQRSYNDFDFSHHPSYFQPVSSAGVELPFKNKYCAECHGLEEADLEPWQMQLRCKTATPLEIQSFHDIPDALLNRPDCDIAFIPPSEFSTVPCSGYIDRCNMAGLMTIYDAYLEIACLSYTSLFVKEGLYKNVHCYLCNQITTVGKIEATCPKGYEPDVEFHLYPFTSLLSFNTVVDEKIFDSDAEPDKDQTFDEQVKSLVAVCAEGLTMQEDGSCRAYLTGLGIETIVFHLNFKIVLKTFNLYPVSVSDLLVFFIANAETNLNRLPLNDPALCHYSINMILNDRIEVIVENMFTQDHTNLWDFQDHLDVKVDIQTYVPVNTSKAIEEIEKAFLPNETFWIGKSLFEVSFQAVKNDKQYYKRFNVPRNLSNTIFSLNISENEKYAIDANSYNNNNGKGVIPYWDHYSSECPLPDKEIEIWPKPFESRFEILYDDETKYRQFLLIRESDEQGLNVCPIVTTYEANGIFVCSKDFILNLSSSLKVLPIGKSNSTLGYLSIFCISLSLVSLILTVTVYTLLPQLRTFPGLNKMGIVVSLLLYQSFYLVSHAAGMHKIPHLCLFSAVSVHFFLIAYVIWMLLLSYHATRTFNKDYHVPGNSNINCRIVRNCFIVLALSGAFVAANILVSWHNSNGTEFGYTRSPCYIKYRYLILYTVGVPIAIVVLANSMMFLVTALNFCRIPNMTTATNQNFQKVKVLAKLSTVTGATWIFGFIYEFTDNEIFAYFFIILNASTGVFVFFSFVFTSRVKSMLKDKWSVVLSHESKDVSNKTETQSQKPPQSHKGLKRTL